MEGHKLWLTFREGVTLYVNLADLAEEAQQATEGLLVPFQDPAYFSLASIDDYGALVWPNGFDICPDYLFLRGEMVESVLS